MREPLYSLACEISHVSNYKTSITLRVSLCRRHRIRHKNRRKYTKKTERQRSIEEIFILLYLPNQKKTYFCAIKLDTLDCFVPRNDAKRQKVLRLTSQSPE